MLLELPQSIATAGLGTDGPSPQELEGCSLCHWDLLAPHPSVVWTSEHCHFTPFLFTCSGLQEEMELKPKQVCLFAWTDPTKTRKLTWGYSQNFGEHDLLKVNFRRGEVNAEPI